MKKKTLNTKLSVKKVVIADLTRDAINQLKGGAGSWDAWACMSKPCGFPKLHNSIDYCISKAGVSTC
ncbi:MAG TPA: class I lanthipeptide [Chitinophaga sp.]|uniref:class I lanthipeptide n=1 Tax=Chitinophaga sp. TaxID=1869181 RepID=UPI002BBACE38|nr:class I lanthipeptide [Chitinophaga sp.]HVI47782.1 class I lanthipeptide [Chitinophaga sp.]